MRPKGLVTISRITLADGTEIPTWKAIDYGWIAKPEAISDQGAWVRAMHGQGAVHLFGFRPQYRGWSQASFQLLFRALLFESRGATKKE